MFRLTAWLSILFLAGAVTARAADSVEVAADIKVLEKAKHATDGPGLLTFFRARTLGEETLKKLSAQVRLLGDDSFMVREKATEELIAAGRVVLPLLKRALEDSDLEIARRAADCLARILEKTEKTDSPTMVAAAARLLAVRKPVGAIKTLLAYLPAAEDDSVEDALREALVVLAVAEAKPDSALVEALKDKDISRRAAASAALAACKPEHHEPVRKLLKDTSPKVRFQAATSLARAGDKSAVPALIEFLADGPAELAWQTEDLLCRLAGEKAPAALAGTKEEQRRKVRDAWLKWWKENEGKTDLTLLRDGEKLRGLFIVCALQGGNNNTGRVYSFGSDQKVIWEIHNVQGPIDVQRLPNGNVLLAELNVNKVTERDRDGKVVWEHTLPGNALSCQRLPNGNTFMATYTDLIEVTRDGKEVYRHKRDGQIYDARKQRNGHIVYVTNGGMIYELDDAGKELRKVPAGDTSNWGSVELLPNGHFLVCRCGKFEIVEIDADGKEVWKAKADWPTWATRLPNGRTLVACAHSGNLIEFDRDAKEVWKWAIGGRPCRLKRY